MKKRDITFFLSFSFLQFYRTVNELFIKEICKNFPKVYFVNIDNLVESKKRKNYNKKQFLNLPKKIIFINPIDFNSLDLFLKNKHPIIVNVIGREFKYYRLLFYLKKKNMPQVKITHGGDVRLGMGDYEYSHILPFIIRVLVKRLPQKLCAILTSLGIFQKIDIRFESNKVLYNSFARNQKRFFRLPTIYKKFVLVKSKQFDEKYYNTKKKLKEDLILLLDIDVDFPELIFSLKRNFADIFQAHRNKTRARSEKSKDSSGKLDKSLVDEHYEKLNLLLEKLSKTFKKKIVISIHPKYNLNKTVQRFRGRYPVIKYKTKKLIQNSFLILDFGSSAIIDAVVLKKRILSLRSELFKEKKYQSDAYSKVLNLKTLNIHKKLDFSGKILIRDLNSRIKYYDKYLKKYASSNLKVSGNKEIVRILKSKYF
jgi:hypothetical protein